MFVAPFARLLGFAALATSACSSQGSGPAATPAPAPASTPVDAGVDGITAIGSFDPATGAHLDDDLPGRVPPRAPAPRRPGRPIEIILRSTPPGAMIAVDGTSLGMTPQVWSGETGGEHEFTFTRPGFAMARFRFVPITTGILHPRLDPVADDSAAGTPPPELALPPAAPPAITPPAITPPAITPPAITPPVTMVSPDAAPAPVPVDAPPDAMIPPDAGRSDFGPN